MSSKSNSTASNGSTATATMAAANGTPKYEARLCHVVKRPDFDGYGFNLHAEKGRPGQYIGKVDDASPAEAAGLRQGDRIIEVNGTNITTETHKKVVELIKAVPNETRLLVIDPRADANDLKLALAKSAAAATAAATATPATNGTANNNNNTVSNGTSNNAHHANGTSGQKADKKEVVTAAAAASVEDKSPKTSGNGTTTTINNNNSINNNNHSSNGNGPATPSPTMDKIIDDTKKVLTVTDGAVSGKMALNGTTESAPAQTNGNGTTEPSKATEGKKLNLPMTAAEMRAQLAARKKYDPKSEVCDLRKKYEIIQKM